MTAVLSYTITTHSHLAGVGLSKAGFWGGIRHASDAEAAEAARIDAGASPYTIERKTIRSPLRRLDHDDSGRRPDSGGPLLAVRP